MYLSWAQETITDFSPEHVNAMYDRGFVFTRPSEGQMEQTRSIRIDLSKFELSSENRRIIKKTEGLGLSLSPLPYTNYNWEIGKLAKIFYETKFGDKTFSANKIKELLTGGRKDFNRVFVYTSLRDASRAGAGDEAIYSINANAGGSREMQDEPIGVCIAVETDEMIHYSYPFYDLEKSPKDMGLGMMTRAAIYAKENGKKYLYLGSFQRPTDTYKLQFEGLEWFDGEKWKVGFETLKKLHS